MYLFPKIGAAALLLTTALATGALAASPGCGPGVQKTDGEGGTTATANGLQKTEGEGGTTATANGLQKTEGEGGTGATANGLQKTEGEGSTTRLAATPCP